MAVYYKNAIVEVFLPEGQGDVQPSVQREVHVQPATPQLVYETFGPDVTAKFLLLDEPEAAPYYAVFGRVIVDGVTYAISGTPQVLNVVPLAAHVLVALGEVN